MDPDQTAPTGAVWSGLGLNCLSMRLQIVGFIQK